MPRPTSDPPPKVVSMRQQREVALAADRRKILSLPPEQALDAVLAHPFPVTLVQSMAEEDLHLLVHTIGPDDALPVLGLASNEQWGYFLDMETWTHDRLHPHFLTEWLARLLQSDPDRFTHWITGDQRPLFEYYLFRNIELHVREYEQDPGELGDGFSSEDDVHYVRMRPYPDEHQPRQEMRDQFLKDLLRRISVYDFEVYRNVLLASSGLIGAETEEELLRLRNVRLAEKGFLPFEEAVGVYQPLDLEGLHRRGRKPVAFDDRPVTAYSLPEASSEAPEDADRFAVILARIQDEVLLQRLKTEFAALCNQVIVADLQKVRDRRTLARVVAKVARFIGIGLEVAEAGTGGSDPYHAANLLQSHLLSDIFRVGYGRVLEVKWQADRWCRQSWFQGAGLPLSFWGETWLGVLGGLLIKKPLYYDNYATGVLYREFRTLADIQTTAAILDRIMTLDRLLAELALPVPRPAPGVLVTYRNLMLTAWANHMRGAAGEPDLTAPLVLRRFRPFFEQLWQAGLQPRRIKDSMRQAFLDWLALRSSWGTAVIAEDLGKEVDALFARMETDLGAVSARDLDPRFVHLFLLCADSEHGYS